MNYKYVAAALSTLVLFGCSSKPDCGSGSAEKLITGLVKENNLLDNLYQGAFLSKNLKDNQNIDANSSSELNKLKADLTTAQQQLQAQVQQCISSNSNAPEMTSAATDIDQLKAKIADTQANPPKMQMPSDAEMFKMPPQQSTQVRRDAENKWNADRKQWGDNIMAMNRNLQQMTTSYDQSSEYIKRACSLDKENAVKLRAYPSLADKVNAFVVQNVEPANAKVAQINNNINASVNNNRLSKEEKTAKDIAQTNENIKNAKLKLEDVVTLSKNQNTGAVTCRARLNIEVKDLVQTKGTIYYNLEQTSKGDLYGTITRLTD